MGIKKKRKKEPFTGKSNSETTPDNCESQDRYLKADKSSYFLKIKMLKWPNSIGQTNGIL